MNEKYIEQFKNFHKEQKKLLEEFKKNYLKCTIIHLSDSKEK
jgi:hypothetical protein